MYTKGTPCVLGIITFYLFMVATVQIINESSKTFDYYFVVTHVISKELFIAIERKFLGYLVVSEIVCIFAHDI